MGYMRSKFKMAYMRWAVSLLLFLFLISCRDENSFLETGKRIVLVEMSGYVQSRAQIKQPQIDEDSELLVLIKHSETGATTERMTLAQLKKRLASLQVVKGSSVTVNVYYQKKYGNVKNGMMGYILEPNQMFESPDELLHARCIIDGISDKVVLRFSPMLHLLRLSLDCAKNVDVRLKAKTFGVVDLEKGEIVPVETSPVKHIYPSKRYKNEFFFYLLPGEAGVQKYGKNWLEMIVTDKGSVKYLPIRLNDLPDGKINLRPGHLLNVNVSVGELDCLSDANPMAYANSTQWVYGVTPPGENQWAYPVKGNGSVDGKWGKMVKWSPGKGWYDCNKVYKFLNAEGEPDMNLCWAAGTANMIHWWLEHNRDNITKYGKYNGPSGEMGSDPLYPSEIYRCFTEKFSNMGGYEQVGYFWFFNNQESGNGAIKNYKMKGGFFNDVISPDFPLLDATPITDQNDMDSFMATAFKQKRAINVTVKFPGTGEQRTLHIMSIWGADFDDKGHVRSIYLTNADDPEIWYYRYRSKKDSRYAMFKRKIEVDEKGKLFYNEPGYLIPGRTYILRLASLDLGTRYWKQYFECRGN